MIDAVGNPQSLLLLGGTSDIALATAERYARQRPLRIVLAARPSDRLEAAAERLRETGSTVTTVPFDARDPDSHAETLDKAFGEGDIDISIVAFGVLGDQEKLWTDVAAAREMAEINYVAPVTVGVLLAEHLRKQGHGHIVALSSVAGERVRRSNFAYGSAKAGMDGFYTGLTEALRPAGIKVTVVRPGHVKSKMTEGLREAPLAQTPEQVADIIVNAVRKGRELVWAPAQFRYVMSVLRHLPRVVFRRLPF
ncbi:decaprenylphospho-beta-D-erythro-pentofuranosid-2-ulose 2-reductase [Actinopolyspora erythraea]|uniref:Decaprenylphospho-beta-D-erythro-pentofuranosid-2-ulose 2-reductase n=1 Tax=Actinopolyspora erythraea TaxID=414996 RepID=A0A099DAS8_9ACTN|nr:decaprenylphospho-beta-D-erythro-pentofuranosid-2-ulose 2-reductase [Actinopolyspora erythraea]ASU77102.1 decaprenylphospho-beta-D-erythro-pentofuranosid-2-ulose 2-reductase [Actinopolyspora erythraea]KGI83209.1 short-chain dehydrogenase [Actinopolyspora erythraea]